MDWKNLIILDCCAGGNPSDEFNAAHDMSYPVAINSVFGNRNVHTIDLRENSYAQVKSDYLTYHLDYQPDIIITNPPFNIALEIIKKALNDVKEDGYVIMLLRLNFFGSDERFPFFQEYVPEWSFVHHKRIGFTDKKDEFGRVVFDKKTGLPKKGSTDSIEYQHLVFRKGYKPEYTKLVVI